MIATPAPEGRPGPVLYQHSAELFDLRYAQKDYAAESATFITLLHRLHPGAVRLLDVACGTGRHLEHLRTHYSVEGLDLNPALLRIARRRVPGAALHLGDMTTFALGRTFDIVTCFFASLPYLGSVEGMRQAVSRMAAHVAAEGLLFVEPGLTPASYREGEVVHNLRRTPERTVSWMYVQRRVGHVAVWDIHWLVGTAGGTVEHFVEREELALFTTEELLDAMRDANLAPVHVPRGLHGYGALVGRKGRAWTSGEIAAIGEVLDQVR
jgi:SAM-dependent methyltransferase